VKGSFVRLMTFAGLALGPALLVAVLVTAMRLIVDPGHLSLSRNIAKFLVSFSIVMWIVGAVQLHRALSRWLLFLASIFTLSAAVAFMDVESAPRLLLVPCNLAWSFWLMWQFCHPPVQNVPGGGHGKTQ
jgi:hypothetical protein